MKGETLTERAKKLDTDERIAYRITSDTDRVSTRVIRGIEEIVGADDDRRTWLYDSVDPDALDALFSQKHSGGNREDGKVVFTAKGCEVVVHGDGEIHIYASETHDADE
ncbi:HalOD1 output domain-containing protein [Haladaptatus cibarius]|uniref:HalOD1 output domain-containing protein n=1 Tax=Haladaptatus cibarius TaxID=453847 RepID=UPI000678AB7E|nr:HalOD1 output domain-containing protein [Haladaptatus cibarius]